MLPYGLQIQLFKKKDSVKIMYTIYRCNLKNWEDIAKKWETVTIFDYYVQPNNKLARYS